jgi:hypothetical protein
VGERAADPAAADDQNVLKLRHTVSNPDENGKAVCI